jgi:hypothetical protein
MNAFPIGTKDARSLQKMSAIQQEARSKKTLANFVQQAKHTQGLRKAPYQTPHIR